ncbi:MAG: PilZ domain-containing protein [Proteobacteria bacterium]|nr:PilZ domain-containing protein [Pseudomonadota bacterium]
MSLRCLQPRVVVVAARDESFTANCQTILSRLGYSLLSPEAFEEALERDNDLEEDVCLVDAERADEILDDRRLEAPVVLLTGRHGVMGSDPRVVGAVKRPAGIHDVYCVLQQLLEEVPRTVLRVATHLPATCRREEKAWQGEVLSLSQAGCLLRSDESPPLGSLVTVGFELPGFGDLELEAETAYQLLPDLGLVFHAAPPQQRDAIAAYVADELSS